MTKNTPDSAAINILREERLSHELLGVELQVQVKDFGGQPVPGWPFSINTGNQVLAKGTTNESGEYRGQRVLQLRADAKMRIFLVLEGSAVTAVQSVPKEAVATFRMDVDKIRDLNEVYPKSYKVEGFGPSCANLYELSGSILTTVLASYDPFQQSITYGILMDANVFDESLQRDTSNVFRILMKFLNQMPWPGDSRGTNEPVYKQLFWDAFDVLGKRAIDFKIEAIQRRFESLCPDENDARIKSQCIILDLEKVKRVLTTERLAKLQEASKKFKGMA